MAEGQLRSSRSCENNGTARDVRLDIDFLGQHAHAVGTSNAKLLQGTLDMLILKALMHGEMHGYGIARRIQQLAREALTVEEGSLYPALQRLAQQGWLKGSWRV